MSASANFTAEGATQIYLIMLLHYVEVWMAPEYRSGSESCRINNSRHNGIRLY